MDWRRSTKSNKERFEDDFVFQIQNKNVIIHQGEITNPENPIDIGKQLITEDF